MCSIIYECNQIYLVNLLICTNKETFTYSHPILKQISKINSQSPIFKNFFISSIFDKSFRNKILILFFFWNLNFLHYDFDFTSKPPSSDLAFYALGTFPSHRFWVWFILNFTKLHSLKWHLNYFLFLQTKNKSFYFLLILIIISNIVMCFKIKS